MEMTKAVGKMMSKGRVTFWKPEGTYELPHSLEVVGEVTDVLRGLTLVIVEGDQLPTWQKGTRPWEFISLEELVDYQLNRLLSRA